MEAPDGEGSSSTMKMDEAARKPASDLKRAGGAISSALVEREATALAC
jgi:hypothetical protein